MTQQRDLDNVQFCLVCGCKTWHYGPICEWEHQREPHQHPMANPLANRTGEPKNK